MLYIVSRYDIKYIKWKPFKILPGRQQRKLIVWFLRIIFHVALTFPLPGFKYSLVFIRDGKRVVGYDNEGKGDHRHYKGREHQYTFRGIDELIKDFFEDIRRYKDENKAG